MLLTFLGSTITYKATTRSVDVLIYLILGPRTTAAVHDKLVAWNIFPKPTTAMNCRDHLEPL